MKEKKYVIVKKSLVILLSFAMFASLMPFNVKQAAAAKNEIDRKDNSIVYFVDAGDYVVNTVCTGDQLGTRNSRTDQIYGEDPGTGYYWGVVDTVSSPLKNGSSNTGGVYTDYTWAYEMNAANTDTSSKNDSNRYTKNQYENDILRYIDYKFEVDAGKYNVEVRTSDPWNCAKSPKLLINSADATADFRAGKGTALSPNAPSRVQVTMASAGDLTVSLRADGDDNRAINLCYIKITDANKQPVGVIGNAQLDAQELFFNSTYLYDNITLPTSGEHGSQITWESSDESVLGSDGKVKRPGLGQPDAVVQLTAKIYDGSQTLTKAYIFTVLAESPDIDIQQFALNEVELLDDYYLAGQNADIGFLKKFDNDRLIYHFRDMAGLDTKGARSYTGWENTQIGGHTVGHYLTAVAQAVKATGDQELEEKLEYIVHEIRLCQDKIGTGYIFGSTVDDRNNIEKQFDVVEGKVSGSSWVPWYTMHKVLAGFIDVYKFTGNEEALQVASNLGEWVYNRVSKWTQQTNNNILGQEYGGMNDALYELYYYTKNTHHRDAAHKFDDPNLYRLITSGNANTLSGRHANATIPKFVGSIKRYEVLTAMGEATAEDELYLEYGKKFFDIVLNKHAYITGGCGDMEHFKDDNTHDMRRTQCNCENCCSYNLLKMAKELYKITGERKYADYYENTLKNAIMSDINTGTGAMMYFMPMATGYFKVYGTDDPATNMFWCCTGTGLEGYTKLGDSIYFHKDDNLFVNQYISSKVYWDDGNMVVTQTADVTHSDVATFDIVVNGGRTSDAAINLRVPDWIAGTPVVKVNGEVVNNAIVSGGYIKVDRTWSNGDELSIQYPMELKAVGLIDNSTVFGFKYGPTVLAAKLGTESMDQLTGAGVSLSAPYIKVVGREQAALSVQYNNAPRQILGTETLTITDNVSLNEYMESINQYLVRDESADEPTFKLEGTDADDNITGGLTFVPFNTITKTRYGIYWYFDSSVAETSPEQMIATKEEARDGKSIIDSLQPGYGQYELDNLHQMTESNSVASDIVGGGSTRHAKAGGYFKYNMIVDTAKNNVLRCHFAKEDNGKTLKISVGDTVVKELTLNYTGSEDFYDINIDLPADVVAANAKKITADDGSGNPREVTVVSLKFESAGAADSARLVGGLYMTTQFSKNASITSILCDGGTVRMNNGGSNIDIYVPTTSTTAKYRVVIADQYGLLYINDTLVNDAKYQTVVLPSEKTVVNAKVFAEDHETSKEYTLTFIKGEAPPEEQANPNPTNNPAKPVISDPAQAGSELAKTTLPKSVTVYKGKTKKIDIGYTDVLANSIEQKIVTVKSVEYSSSNKKVAKVSADGKIKGVKKGSAKITVKITLSTGDTITLTTTAKVKNPSVKITGKKTVKKGKTIKLKAKGLGVSGKAKWSVSNKKIAKIGAKNGKLKGLKKGTVKVTAKIGKVKKTIKVKVK